VRPVQGAQARRVTGGWISRWMMSERLNVSATARMMMTTPPLTARNAP
jgi:hypothetical protein